MMDYLSEQVLLSRNDMEQLKTMLADNQRALQTITSVTKDKPSVLQLPLCKNEEHEDFAAKLHVDASVTQEALAVLGPEPENPFRQPLAKYPGLIRPKFSVSVPPHDVVHHKRTTGPPVFSRPRRPAPTRLSAAKAEFEDMLQMDTIRQSESSWVAPLHVVPKAATGNRCPCEILGHLVDSNGIYPLPSMAAAIRDFPAPSSKRQLQRLLDMVNFYRRSLPHCADTILPPTSLPTGPKGSSKLSADALTVFDKAKADLADATLLTNFSPGAPISLMVDASNVAVGAVLQQHIASHTQPLPFFPGNYHLPRRAITHLDGSSLLCFSP
ncbi:hypothetical protein SprV_0802494200 [Sparganum proliferum]